MNEVIRRLVNNKNINLRFVLARNASDVEGLGDMRSRLSAEGWTAQYFTRA